MAALLTALGSGVSARKILEYLMRKSPELAPKITSALASGVTADKVLKFFTKDKNFDKLKQSMEKNYPMKNNANPLVQAENVRSKNLGTDMASGLQRATPGILGAAGGIGLGMAMQHALPNLLKGPIQGTAQKNQGMPQVQSSNQVQQPVNQPQAPNISQPAQPVQPQGIVNPREYLDKLGIRDKVDSLLNAGNTPEGTAAAISIKRSGESKIDPELLANIDAYSKETPESKVSTTVPTEKIEDVIEPVKIAKNDTVASPNGIGTIREIRNGQALVEVDGKIHKVAEDELISSPLPEKELADLYDDLISGIEKESGQQVSRNVDWAGYDPKSNELAYKPHGSDKLYAYDAISPEDIELLTSLLTKRKSTGENFIGVWKSGTTSPIGAAMYQLIQKLQKERGGKGNEYKNRYDTIYDALEPAKLAAKQRHAERKKKAKKPRID